MTLFFLQDPGETTFARICQALQRLDPVTGVQIAEARDDSQTWAQVRVFVHVPSELSDRYFAGLAISWPDADSRQTAESNTMALELLGVHDPRAFLDAIQDKFVNDVFRHGWLQIILVPADWTDRIPELAALKVASGATVFAPRDLTSAAEGLWTYRETTDDTADEFVSVH